MKVLHIAHYDRYPHEATTFFDKPLNGIEKWLGDMIKLTNIEHYILFFNHYENTIFIEKINSDGRATIHASYSETTFKKSELEKIFKDIIFWLPLDLVHIHYLQEYTKDIPQILYDLYCENIIVTMHDESYLGAPYGINKEYRYDERVKNFFLFSKKVVFIHEITKKRFERYYHNELKNKSLVISNGIDILSEERYDYNETSSLFKVLFLGTMHKVKGGDILFELSNNKVNDVEFYLLGSIESKPKYLVDCGRYNKDNIVERVTEINPDIIVIPSIAEETFSYTAAEATAMGYPIVCFNVGVLENIKNEKRGFIAYEKSAVKLLEKILELKEIKNNSPKEWKSILKDINEVKVPDVQEMVEKYEKLYSTILKDSYNTKQVNWEHVMELNLKEKKRKELLYLYKNDELANEKAWKNTIPNWMRKSYTLYKKMKKRKNIDDK